MSAEPSHPAHPRPPFIATAPARALLAPLEQGLGARAPLLLITGTAGTGKSTLAAEALQRWGERAVCVELPWPAPDEGSLARTLMEMFGGKAKPGASAPAVNERLMAALANATSGGRVAVVLADDAHELSTAQLVELHRLAEAATQRQCPLEVLLVGLPALENKFSETALAAVRPRIAVRGRLSALSPSDTREYLQMRRYVAGSPNAGVFSRTACRDIHAASLGVLRTIETLAEESLRRAQRAGSATVSPEHVRAAAKALRSARSDETAHTLPPRLTVAQGDDAEPATADETEAGTRAETRAEAAEDAAAPAAEPAAAAKPAPPKPNRSQPSPAMRAAPPPPAPPEKPITKPVPPSVRPEAARALPEPEFPASNDPRVKEWVARFGGSGVRIGAATAGHAFSEAELREDALVVEGASAAAATGDSTADDAGEPRMLRGSRRAMPPLRRRANVPVGPIVGVVLVLALAAIAFAQRHAIGKLATDVVARATTHAAKPAAEATPVAPSPAPVSAPEPPRQFTIAVGYYPTRDMATAESDYLSRLVPLRVRVASAGRGTHAYRLLLGRFDDASDAELAIQRLQDNGLIPDARVITAPPPPPTAATATPPPSSAPTRHSGHSGRRHSRR